MKSPTKQTTLLYQLQTLDTRRDRLKKRLTEIHNAKTQNAAIAAAEAALAEAQNTRSHWQTRKTDLELERQSLTTESEESENRLYSGEVSNPREMEELQAKVEELKRRHGDLEAPLDEAILMLDEWDTQLKDAEAEAERVRQEQADAIADLDSEQQEIEEEMESLAQEAEKLRSRIQDSYLQQYDRLRQTHGGIAVSKLRGDECSTCGMGLTSRVVQRVKRGSIEKCPTCGRLLSV